MLGFPKHPAVVLTVAVLPHGGDPEVAPRGSIVAHDQPAELHDPLAEELRRLVEEDHVHPAAGCQAGEGRGHPCLELSTGKAAILRGQDGDIQVARGTLPPPRPGSEDHEDRERKARGGFAKTLSQLVHRRKS